MKKQIFTLLTTCFFAAGFTDQIDTTWVHEYIETVPDFPKPGIQFKCFPKLLKNPEAFKKVTKVFAEKYRDRNIDVIVGLDARGFVFGTALAYEMNLPFVMVRKGGKLPKKVERIEYGLEYSNATFEIEVDSIKEGERVLIVDDLLATGGTANAAATLVERIGGVVVEVACLIELEGLNGRENLKYPFYSMVDIEVDE